MKRLFDFTVSLIGLVILSPILILISILVVFTSPGGIFFRGSRVGRQGKQFRIFKFRSMIKGAEGQGKWNVGNNDPRVTPIGKFLRNSKLDEFPQLINVLKGDMSLVGPRPEMKIYVDMYSEHEKVILDLKPGLTDWASIMHYNQVKVFTNSIDSDKAYLEKIRPQKLKLQLYYRHNNSFLGDVKLIFLTVSKLLTRKDAVPKEIQFLFARNEGDI